MRTRKSYCKGCSWMYLHPEKNVEHTCNKTEEELKADLKMFNETLTRELAIKKRIKDGQH